MCSSDLKGNRNDDTKEEEYGSGNDNDNNDDSNSKDDGDGDDDDNDFYDDSDCDIHDPEYQKSMVDFKHHWTFQEQARWIARLLRTRVRPMQNDEDKYWGPRPPIVYVHYNIDMILMGNSLPPLISNLFETPISPVKYPHDSAIVIVGRQIHTAILDELINIYENKKQFVVVMDNRELLFDRFQHEYVPHHFLIPLDEKKELQKKYNVQESMWPTISRFDPIARLILLRPGCLCGIRRRDMIMIGNEKEELYYRLCENKNMS